MDVIDRWCNISVTFVTVFASFWWGERSVWGLVGAVGGWLGTLPSAVVLTAIWLVVALLIHLLAAGRGRRLGILELVLFPVWTLLVWLLAVLAAGVVAYLFFRLFDYALFQLPIGLNLLLCMPPLMAALFFVGVLLGLVLPSLLLVPMHAFRAVDGHPTLPEVVGVVAGAGWLVIVVIALVVDAPGLSSVDLAVSAIPATAAIVLGLCGLARLKRRFGVGLGWLPGSDVP